MTLAIYFHPKSLTAEQYDRAITELAAVAADHPAGRSHHSCFGPDDDLMVYEVWESQEAFEEYGKVLMPVLNRIGIDPGAPDVMSVHNIIA
jgi:Antibiotic biosynthesis monooxygenase